MSEGQQEQPEQSEQPDKEVQTETHTDQEQTVKENNG